MCHQVSEPEPKQDQDAEELWIGEPRPVSTGAERPLDELGPRLLILVRLTPGGHRDESNERGRREWSSMPAGQQLRR
jgi:hypothetical protein